MLTRQQFSLRLAATMVTFVALILASAPVAFAQEGKQSSPVADVIKGVVFDPTTYAPAAIGYDATMRDWNTSQPFFRNGFVEHNARFTVSGLPDDQAVSYTVGRQRILRDAAAVLGVSAAQNLTSRLVEHALLRRYPEHRTAVKVI